MGRKRARLAAIVLAVVAVVGAALCWTTAGITRRALYAGCVLYTSPSPRD